MELPSETYELIRESVAELPHTVSRREVARFLGCHVDHVTRLLNNGELVAVQRKAKKNTRIRILRASLQRYLERTVR